MALPGLEAYETQASVPIWVLRVRRLESFVGDLDLILRVTSSHCNPLCHTWPLQSLSLGLKTCACCSSPVSLRATMMWSSASVPGRSPQPPSQQIWGDLKHHPWLANAACVVSSVSTAPIYDALSQVTMCLPACLCNIIQGGHKLQSSLSRSLMTGACHQSQV